MEKRIVILTKYFPPEMGAPQSRLYETVLGLEARGWEVKVVTAMPNYPKGRIFEGYRGRFRKRESYKGLDVVRYTLFASHSKKSFPRIVSMFSFSFTALFSVGEVRRFKPAYIFTESPPLTMGLTGLFLAKCSGARHILNVSDIWPLSALRLGAISEGYVYRKLELLENYLYKCSYACTGQSEEIVERLKGHGSKQAQLYRNGVDTERFTSVYSHEQNDKVVIRIVYAGLLGLAQGIAELCEKVDFKKIDVEFHIYGEGSEREEIANFIANNPNRNIFLHDSVKRHQVPSVLMKYDCTLIPLKKSIYGAVPSKLYESLAAGLPVVFAGGGEGQKIVDSFQVGWSCAPSDYKAITNTIADIGKMNKDEIDAMKERCRDVALNEFDRKIQIERLHNFLLGKNK